MELISASWPDESDAGSSTGAISEASSQATELLAAIQTTRARLHAVLNPPGAARATDRCGNMYMIQ